MVCACDITAGMLNRLITITRRTETPDGMGGVTEAWADVETLRASVKPVGGRERAYAGRVEAQVDYRAIIRFAGDADGNPAYTADDRVDYRNKTYGIEYIYDVEDAKMWLEIGLRAAK